MKYKLSTFLFCAAALIASHSVSAQAGLLDSDFDGDGVRIDSFDTNTTDFGSGVRVQPDGKVVVSGWSEIAGDKDMVIVRYNTDGSPDQSFGYQGKTGYNLGANYNDQAHSIDLQPDGKIVLCGNTDSAMSVNQAIIVLRLKTNGRPDSTFGSNGFVSLSLSGADGYAVSVAVNKNNGKIAVTGYGGIGAFLYQLNPDGSPDNGFGTGGRVLIQPSVTSILQLRAVAYQPDNKPVVAGVNGPSGAYGFFAARFMADGSVDNSFSVDGSVVTRFSTTSVDNAYGLLVQSDGKIVLVGSNKEGSVYNVGILRYNADGTLDLSLNGSGKAAIVTGGNNGQALAVAQASDGKYLVSALVINGAAPRYGVLRLRTDGTPDSSFGTAGIVVTNVGNGNFQQANAIAQAPDGRIVQAGGAGGSITTSNLATARYLSGLHVGITDLHTTATAALIYPNPIQQTETLRYTLSADEKVSIQLYSLDGKLIQEFITDQPRTSGENVETLHFAEGLAGGTYILRLSTAQGECSIRVVK